MDIGPLNKIDAEGNPFTGMAKDYLEIYLDGKLIASRKSIQEPFESHVLPGYKIGNVSKKEMDWLVQHHPEWINIRMISGAFGANRIGTSFRKGEFYELPTQPDPEINPSLTPPGLPEIKWWIWWSILWTGLGMLPIVIAFLNGN